MTERTALTVGEVAERFGVTVRTLHYYDEIGLLRPSRRSPAGYRQYTEADLTRLQHVVVYRRLGFALETIADLLDDRPRTSRSTCAASGSRSPLAWRRCMISSPPSITPWRSTCPGPR